jgi:hypothetical protein
MIIYSKSFGGLPLALRFGRGSPLTRNLLWPLLSVALTVLLYTYTCKKVPEPLSALDGDDGGDGEVPGHCVVKCVLASGLCGVVSLTRITVLRAGGCSTHSLSRCTQPSWASS